MAPERSLDDLLERRRKACATFESSPSETTADAGTSHSGPKQLAGNSTNVVVKHEDESCHHRDLGELKLLLAERHGRCHVLQNNPKERQADAIWNVAFHTEGAKSQNLESLPGKHVADYRYEAQEAQPPNLVSSERSTSRPKTASAVVECEASAHLISEKMQVIREVEEKMTYLKFEEDHLVTILCMFLRYHDPETICQIERCNSDGLSPSYLHDLCVTPSPLAFFLGKLDLSETSRHVDIKTLVLPCVLHLCTFLVDGPLKLETETSEVRIFFLLLAAFRNLWRSAMAKNSGEKATAVASPVQLAELLWEEAASMLDATPRSLWYLCHSPVFTVKMPICRVAADEVLQHIYERPSMDWRLVVLDARHKSQPDMALPVCLRVEEMMETQLPRDEQIHLCIVGDDLNHAQMLAEHLVTQQMCHISVVEGGWEAIEHLVAALGLELLPPSPQKEPKDGDKLGGPERVADDLQGPTTWMLQSIQSWTTRAWHSGPTPASGHNELLDL